MNRFTVLRYQVQPRDEDDVIYGATDLVVPVIDDVPLFQILGDRWPGVPAEWVLPPSGQWTGSPEHVEFGRSVVLDGSCGEAECCGVVARISIGPDTVVWDDFYSLGAPDLPEGMRFEFLRSDYETRLQGLAQLPAIEWIETDESAY